MTKRAGILLCLIFIGFQINQVTALAETSRKTRRPVGDAAFQTQIKPLLSKYCFGCHGEKKKGDLDLRVYTDEASVLRDRKTFSKVEKNLQAHEMPPEKKPLPTPEERELITAWIQSEIFKCDCDHPDPGRVTIHRLNRAVYNNTIRDLVGVNFRPADDFPADDSGYGFDNIGDVLSMSPLLAEKYLAAAEQVMDRAIQSSNPYAKKVKRFTGIQMEPTVGQTSESSAWNLSNNGELFKKYDFPAEAEYELRIRAYGDQFGDEPPK